MEEEPKRWYVIFANKFKKMLDENEKKFFITRVQV